MVRESKDLSRLAICCSTSSTACPFQTERGQVVTLTEVKDALFRAYLQVDNRSYSSTCQFYVSLSLLIVTAWSVCNYHEVAFPPTVWLEGGRSMRPPLSSPWHYTKQQAVSGVSPTLLRWSPTPHSSQVSRDCLEKPSMKSKTWIQLHYTVLLTSPASVSTRDHRGDLVEAYALYLTFCSQKGKKSHTEVTKRDPRWGW